MRGRALRESLFFAAWITLALVFAGCGGGGGAGMTADPGGTVGAPAGPAAVDLTISASTVSTSMAAPVSAAPGSAAPASDRDYFWAREIRDLGPTIEHVYMEVVKVSLMPAEETFESGDMDGDLTDVTPADPAFFPGKPRFVTIVPDRPVRIDLLHLEDGEPLAHLMDRFDSVPAGTYDKIRVQYRRVKIALADGTTLNLHPTMHSKFDIRFRKGSELVIPPGPDVSLPDGWVKLFRVNVEVTGVKVKFLSRGRHWKGCRVLLRPQIWAEAVTTPPALTSVGGTVVSVTREPEPSVSGVFEVATGGTTSQPTPVPIAFDGNTTWRFSGTDLNGSSRVVDVTSALGAAALRETAIVEVQGSDAGGVFRATDITITFPEVASGVADNVWQDPEGASIDLFMFDTFSGVAVYPMPGPSAVYYDNNDIGSSHEPLNPGDIAVGTLLTARGYASHAPDTPGRIDAWWVSWDGNLIPE
jgi:hypothetical protein